MFCPPCQRIGKRCALIHDGVLAGNNQAGLLWRQSSSARTLNATHRSPHRVYPRRHNTASEPYCPLCRAPRITQPNSALALPSMTSQLITTSTCISISSCRDGSRNSTSVSPSSHRHSRHSNCAIAVSSTYCSDLMIWITCCLSLTPREAGSSFIPPHISLRFPAHSRPPPAQSCVLLSMFLPSGTLSSFF